MDVLVEVQPFDDAGSSAAGERLQVAGGRRRRGGGASSLTFSTLLAYTQMKASLIFGDLAVGAVVPVYLEVFGLNIGSLAIVRALAKSIDFLVAFAIGFVSDTWRSSWGRRLPFILFGSIFAPISLWALASPPAELTLAGALAPARRLAELLQMLPSPSPVHGGAGSSSSSSSNREGGGHRTLASFRPFSEMCSAEAAAAAAMAYAAPSCAAVRACLDRAISSEELPPPTATKADRTAATASATASAMASATALAASASAAAAASRSFQLTLWFFFWFTMRHSVGHTVVQCVRLSFRRSTVTAHHTVPTHDLTRLDPSVRP
jgi:hypothetical protein